MEPGARDGERGARLYMPGLLSDRRHPGRENRGAGSGSGGRPNARGSRPFRCSVQIGTGGGGTQNAVRRRGARPRPLHAAPCLSPARLCGFASSLASGRLSGDHPRTTSAGSALQPVPICAPARARLSPAYLGVSTGARQRTSHMFCPSLHGGAGTSLLLL